MRKGNGDIRLTENNKFISRRSFFRKTGVLCFVLALALLAATYIVTLPSVKLNLDRVMTYFDNVELFIASLNKVAALAVILLLFAIKAFVPVVPLSVIFIASGMVFKNTASGFINVLGFCILCSVKFLWGRRYGGGGTHRFLTSVNSLQSFMKLHGTGNKWMLVLLRFVPFVPINAVSRLYGATSITLWEFLFYSVLGYLPRLISWGVVGCNITNPFTASFTAPISALLVISGISLFLVNFFIDDNPERKI